MRAFVLSSGGLDSTTALSVAIDSYGKENVISVSIMYGQKHVRELNAASRIAEYYEVKHEVLDLSEIYAKCNCSLLSHSTEDVPEGSYAEQLDGKITGVDTAIPFRNGLMLSALAAFAQSLYPEDDITLFLGNHADDSAGNAYADCSKEFSDAIGKAIWIGTYNKVDIATPFVNWNKGRVVKKGLELNVPYYLTTSCYNGKECACGKCGTCLDRIDAFKANGVIDPIDYEIDIDWSGCKKIKYL